MLTPIINDPLFGLGLTVLAFYVGKRLFEWKPIVIFNPLIIAPLIVALTLLIAEIPYEDYNQGAQVLTYFLGPATVALGVPLYKRMSIIKDNLKTILIGTITASIVSVFSVISLGKIIGLSEITIYSLAAKSATAPISLGITEKLGGLEPILILSVVITGIFGGIIGAEILKFAGVKNKITTGFSLGCAAHAGGTARAFLLGQKEGTFSGIAMVLTGLGIAIIAPILVKIMM